MVLFGLVIGILFLEETHEEKRHRRDMGLEMGRWILKQISTRKDEFKYSKLAEANFDETSSLVDENDLPPSYSSAGLNPSTKSQDSLFLEDKGISITELDHEGCEQKAKPATQSAFTFQVMLNVVSYGILA